MQNVGDICIRAFHFLLDLIKGSVAKFHPKPAMQTDAMHDLDGAIRDAVKLKFLDKPMTKEQVAEFIVIPKR